jgi:hypothetical protein
MPTLDEMMEDYDRERLAEIEREDKRRETPEYKAKIAAKKQREFETNVRNGSITPDGESIEQPEDEDEEDED